MKTKPIALTLLAAVLLAACAPATPVVPTADVSAIRTSAVYTFVADWTLTSAAFTFTPSPIPPTETPSPVPLPTETPTFEYTTDPTMIALGTPGAICDDFTFDLATVDVTIPDGTPMTPGQTFVKTWRIKNTGVCTWGEGYTLVFSYGDKMDGQPVPLEVAVQPDAEVDVSINFTAPANIGEYTSAWQMVNPAGTSFGKALFVKIIVQ